MDNQINYKDENIEKKLFSPTKLNIPYLALLFDYTDNNRDFMQQNPELFKKAISGALKDKQIHTNFTNINKVKSQIISFFNYAIEHKEKYENDWLTSSINEYFHLKLPTNRDFYRKVDNLSPKLSQLEFIQNPMSEKVKNIVRGNSPILLHEPITFFCTLDTKQLAHQREINIQSLYCNLRIGLDFLKELLDKDLLVSYKSNFNDTEDQVFSIVVLHSSKELQNKLPKFINYLCYDIDHSIELTKEKMDRVYLRFEMESEISVNNELVKKIKNKI